MLGVYNFTNQEESEFYTIAFNIQAAWTVNFTSRTDLEISSGMIYSSAKYNSGAHSLFAIPLSFSYIINFGAEENGITPFIGAGISGFYKRDLEVRGTKTLYLFSYGYHFLIGIKKPVSEKISLKIILKNNTVMQHRPLGDINISGINTLLGVEYKY